MIEPTLGHEGRNQRATEGEIVADEPADPSDANAMAWNRKGAIEEIDSLKLLRATSLEQHSHAFKWLTASLLALNGGALLGLAQSNGIDVQYRIWGGGLFAIGLASALLVAVFGQRANIASLVPLQRQIGYWMTVSDDGVRVENFETELAVELKRSVRLSTVGQISGCLSALALFAGIFFSGAGIVAHEQKKPTTTAPNASAR